jgi:hypothetical protein
LTLLGTAVYGSAGIGVFVDEATRCVIRLKQGEAHSGWILHSIGRREVQFTKDGKWATRTIRRVHDQPSMPSDNLARPLVDAKTGDGHAPVPPTKPGPRDHLRLPASAAEAMTERDRIRRER